MAVMNIADRVGVRPHGKADHHHGARHDEIGQNEVHERACKQHEEALPEALAQVGVTALLGEKLFGAHVGNAGLAVVGSPLSREVVTVVVFGEQLVVALQGLKRLGPVLLVGLLAQLGVVVGTNGRPLGQRGEKRVGAILVAAKLVSEVERPHAAVMLHAHERVGEELVGIVLHAADARVATEQDGRDAYLGAVVLALVRELDRARHAEEELRHAGPTGARRHVVAALMHKDEKRQGDKAPEDCGNGTH
jgi:hypothetical protein